MSEHDSHRDSHRDDERSGEHASERSGEQDDPLCPRWTPHNRPPWSSFYAQRMAHGHHPPANPGTLADDASSTPPAAPPAVSVAPPPAVCPPVVPTWSDVADVCGPDAADALDILAETWAQRQGHLDWASVPDLRRLAFQVWLMERGRLTENIE